MPEHPTPGVLTGVDWTAVLYAFAMGALTSTLLTLRDYNTSTDPDRPRLRAVPLLIDTLIAGLVGMGGALLIMGLFPRVNNFAGLTLLSGAGGAIGPKVAELWRRRGSGVLLEWAGAQAGAFAKAVAAKGGGHDDERQDEPTRPD